MYVPIFIVDVSASSLDHIQDARNKSVTGYPNDIHSRPATTQGLVSVLSSSLGFHYGLIEVGFLVECL